MTKTSYESSLQTYLTKNHGLNLQRIENSLELIEPEHIFRGGRIDILAKNQSNLVGIELKYNNYQTRGICAQLLNYLNYLSAKDGVVYFIAPKIKYGIYSTLKEFYDHKQLKFFEVTRVNNYYLFVEVEPININDARRVDFQDYTLASQTQNKYNEKFTKGISLIIKDKKKAKLLNNIIDSRKSKRKQLEDITDSIVDIIAPKNSVLKTAYELLKLFEE
jgi:hypothetical protein